MTATEITHRLTFKGVYAEDDDERYYEDWEGEHIGPVRAGMTCGYWEECGVESYEQQVVWNDKPHTYTAHRCPHTPTEDEKDEGEYFAHDEYHQLIDGDFMTFQGCALTRGVDGSADDVHDIFRNHGTGPHSVSVDYWGDGIWEVHKLD